MEGKKEGRKEGRRYLSKLTIISNHNNVWIGEEGLIIEGNIKELHTIIFIPTQSILHYRLGNFVLSGSHLFPLQVAAAFYFPSTLIVCIPLSKLSPCHYNLARWTDIAT